MVCDPIFKYLIIHLCSLKVDVLSWHWFSGVRIHLYFRWLEKIESWLEGIILAKSRQRNTRINIAKVSSATIKDVSFNITTLE